jgi:two-component system CheB/CheR fusion protein
MPAKPSPPSRIPICGIGASAGGVDALQQFFGAVRDNLGLAYVVILHLAPDRKSELPTIIGRCTKMPVLQISDHQKVKLEPDHVYVIAPDRRLEITDTSVAASSFEQPRGQRAAVDLFFRSLAASHGDGYAVVLSGSGMDGAVGARAVKESGGVVLVQDPREAAHPDMPRAAIATGAADVVLPARELAERLAELSHSKPKILPAVQAAEADDAIAEDEQRAFRSVLEVLHKRTGHDFSKYKRTTVLRRLSRRMQLSHQITIADYLAYLRANAGEAQSLFDDLLISVTTFFRDAETWSALQTQVIGPLVENTQADEQIRAWVPGCATGEEAYTLGILFHEEFERRNVHRNLIIFASDVDETALASAREGLYPHAIAADVSEDRLARFFRSDDDHYRVITAIRDNLVFANHSILRDPPFSRLHLISCRNLLIYLDREVQEQVMGVFHYACREPGHLLLGAAEMADEELFEAVDKKHRIFVTRPRTDGRAVLPEILAAPAGRRVQFVHESRPASKSNAGEIHFAALEAVAPPSVLLDDRWNVLHLSASASRFMQQGGGAPARRLTELVRPELRDELHALLHRTAEASDPQLSPFVPVAFNGGAAHRIAILAQQHSRNEGGRSNVLVTFLDGGALTGEPAAIEREPSNDLVRDLREKLRHAEQRIQSMRDDHLLTNEDLRAANEELQSLNEEYRSTTEELETSKEELQSINEELQTVNLELKLKLEEVSRAHDDVENLMSATNVATLFLSEDLRIKRFTPELGELFNVKVRDQDRPIGDLTHSLDYEALEEDARRVLALGAPIERETHAANGRIYVARLSPYRTRGGNEIEGVVATFIDVTAIKKVESALRDSEQKLESELAVMRRLHQMTSAVSAASSMNDALELILQAAIEMHHADMGNVQMFDRDSRRLRIVAHRGFTPAFLERFRSVGEDDASACGRALRCRRTAPIPDVIEDAAFAPFRDIAAAAGFRAVLSTPLIARDGELVGILSVHFREPRVFSHRDEQLSDLLAHHAADLVFSRAQQDRLSAQAQELLEQDRHREEFLAALGHELRNPMSAMQSALALMAAPDERSKRALGVLRRQIHHMTRLVNDLLDITRVKHGKLHLEREPLDLGPCVLSALDTIRTQAESKGLQLRHELPDKSISVQADSERLAQILDNLLRNAVAYTDAGTITVSVRLEATHARITVRDTGTGIDQHDANALFKPYQQREDGRRSGGLGLGLTLVKGLVEAHGGTIGFHSDGRDKGSEFSFTLPLAKTAPMDGHAAPITPLTSRRILVVDDQRDVADMFAALLEQLGQEVTIAYDGATALSLAREVRPQVAFLDLSMPGMNGPDLAHALREDFPNGDLTLIAVTGFGTNHPAARSAEFDHRLLKPVTADSVSALLNSLPPQI